MTSIYHYHPISGEFQAETEARIDPKDKTPMVPGYATLIAPPEAKPGRARVFKDGAWSQVEDHRGALYWTAEGKEKRVEFLGPIPDEALTQKPDIPLFPDLAAARLAMVNWIDGFLNKIAGNVPEFERASWPAKAEAARAVDEGTARPDQAAMIAGEALTSGRTEAEVTAKIIAKADAYEAVISRTTGLRVKLDDQLEAEPDPHKFEAILEAGKTQALSLAAELGIEID